LTVVAFGQRKKAPTKVPTFLGNEVVLNTKSGFDDEATQKILSFILRVYWHKSDSLNAGSPKDTRLCSQGKAQGIVDM